MCCRAWANQLIPWSQVGQARVSLVAQCHASETEDYFFKLLLALINCAKEGDISTMKYETYWLFSALIQLFISVLLYRIWLASGTLVP